MADHLEGAVQSILLPTEKIRVLLETLIVPSPANEDTSPVLIVQEKNRRILAVISHSHASQSHEQGCLFILKPKFLPNGSYGDLVVDNVLPIAGDFSISMTQSKRNTIDTRYPSSALTLNQPRTELTIIIKPGQLQPQGRNSTDTITLVTSDIHQLRSVLAECRNFKKFNDSGIHPATTGSLTESQYSWVLPYTSLGSSVFSAIPPDLRISRLPLHDRLSPTSAGAPGDDTGDIQLIREEWIVNATRESCGKNKSKSDLRIRMGTFNVNGKMPSQDLSAWIRGDQGDGQDRLISPLNTLSLSSGDGVKGEGSYPTADASETANVADRKQEADPHITKNLERKIDLDPDLLVFGFQELDQSTEAFLYLTSTREDAWILAILAGFGEKGQQYEKLASRQLVGMLLIIFVKTSLKDRFSDIRTTSVGAGIMGLMGNKGGTAIRVTYSPILPSGRPSVPTTLTFVNSHLAAFDEMVDRRNADYQDLSRRLLFQYSSDSELEEDRVYNGYPVSMSVFQADALFWMGDLNYRIDLPSEEIRTLLSWPGAKERNFKELLKFDQLNNAVRHGDAFEGFVEHTICHLPTYRFSPGLAMDDLGYDMKRKPAWTDRILHMTSQHTMVEQLSYKGHSGITLSDHRPVSAEFVVSVDSLELGEYETTMRKLDEYVFGMEDQEFTPKVNVEPLSIDFGQIRYEQTTSKSLVIRNSGKVPCAFRFVSLEAADKAHPAWLRVEPKTGLLLTEQAVTINLISDIDKNVASALNLSHERLEFVLILHTELGKDHFISISAQYEPTCFANSLSHLNRLSGPIRTLKSSDQLLSEDKPMNAPKEIMRLVNWMMSADVDMNDLFTSPGDPVLVDIIRECLDTGEEFSFPTGTEPRKIPLAFAETLVQLLDSLTESIIPSALHQECAEVTSKDEAFAVLDQLPPARVNVWIPVTAFLHFVCQQVDSEAGRLDRAKVLAAIFGPIVMREERNTDLLSPLGKRQFLLFFII